MKKFLSFYLIMVFPVIMFAQQTLTGTVTDENGTTLPGVNVSIKGTFVGTATNIDGNFRIQATAGDILVFQFIGYRTLEIEYTGTPILNVILETHIIGLDEVVVVGYGTQARSDITGAVVSISERALNEVSRVTSVQQMLQGRAAGVDVVSTGNKPGDGVRVLIRGRRSFDAGNDPLYIIDGIPFLGGFNDLNPNDIESISILKDASATAIYGSRGANGVIVISTKRGKPGPLTVSYSSYMGVSRIKNPPRLMNGPEYAEFRRNSARYAGLYDDNDPDADKKEFEAVELESLTLGRTTDWYGMMTQDGFVHNNDLRISGGTESSRYSISLGYFDDVGVIPNQEYSRFNARINFDQTIGSRMNLGLSMSNTFSERHGENFNPLHGHQFGFGTRTSNPLAVPYDEDGNLLMFPTSEADQRNPLLDLEPGAFINKRTGMRLLANLYAEVELFDGLKLRTQLGPDFSRSDLGNFRGSRSTVHAGGLNSAGISNVNNMAYTLENILTYNTTFAQSHKINFTGLYSIFSDQSGNSSASVIDLPLESFQYYNLGGASMMSNVSSGFTKMSLVSYMARINYVYDDRYYLTLTGRADGSSKFAGDNKWGYFPSVALAWNIHNEDFLSEIDKISSLRLRLSYGSIGNEGIAPYRTQGLLARTGYDFGGSPAYGYRPFSIRNEDLKWETTTTFNAGIDFGIYAGRISGSLEFYRMITTDLLLPMVLPASSGFSSVLTNVGSKSNEGIEFSVSTHNIVPRKIGGFSWSMDLNLFTNREKILELAEGKVDDIGNRRFIGYPAVVFYDYKKTGIWQLGEEELAAQYSSEVGGIKVKDVNGNGRIDPDDRIILGDDVPDLIGGMTQRFEFRGFDLTIVAYARLGQMIQAQGRNFFLQGRGTNQILVDYWTPDNPTNAYPRPGYMSNPYFLSTVSYYDGSFVRIRSINLGYNTSSEVLQKFGIQSIRAYLNIHNPFTFSSFVSKGSGDDPENPTTLAPLTRSFLVGWNFNF